MSVDKATLTEASRIAIIGAGECGVRAAFELRQKGFRGDIDLFSEEPHLPYERPPLSKHAQVELKPIRQAEAYDEASINLNLNDPVKGIDVQSRTVSTLNGEVLTYASLLIATGARPRLFPGMEKALTLRSLDDAQRILCSVSSGTRLVIVGGGFIGLELAATAVGKGAVVTVLEAGDRLMARAVPASVAQVAQARHECAGVHILCSVPVTGISNASVACADGRTFPADIVVAGVGAMPNVELAQAAGLTVANGVVVDDRFRTSAVDVYAAGDCCAFPHDGQLVRLESWRAAQEQGAHAAACMLGDISSYRRVPWFWSDQYELGLQVAGLLPPGGGTAVTRRVGKQDGFIECVFDDAGRLCCAAGIGPGNTVAKDIRLLEMLMSKETLLDPCALADESMNLKQLLKAV